MRKGIPAARAMRMASWGPFSAVRRGSPEQVIDGWRYFGYQPAEGHSDADMGRRHAEIFLDLLRDEGFAQPNPQPMFPNPPGLLSLEPSCVSASGGALARTPRR
jgi:hypothetical protein